MVTIAMNIPIKKYTTLFTVSELKEILAFYKTSTGSKLVRALPKLHAEGIQEGN